MACYMSQVSEFCLENNTKTVYFNMLSLHKTSLPVKLWWIWQTAWILPNFQLKRAVKVTATIICTQNVSGRNSTWTPFALITIISLSGSWLVTWFNVSWLTWVQQSISTHFSQSTSEILWRYTICCNVLHTEQSTGFRSRLLEASFPIQWTPARESR